MGSAIAVGKSRRSPTWRWVKSDIFRVAPVTTLIVMLPIAWPSCSVLSVPAIDRVIEIVIGNIGAGARRGFRDPARACATISCARPARNLQGRRRPDQQAYLRAHQPSWTPGRAAVTCHRTAPALKQAETAAEEAARERKMRVSDYGDPQPVVRTHLIACAMTWRRSGGRRENLDPTAHTAVSLPRSRAFERTQAPCREGTSASPLSLWEVPL